MLAEAPSIEQLRNLLEKELRVEITDGRVFVGKFNCIDNEKNLILKETVEEQVIKLPNAPGMIINKKIQYFSFTQLY